MEGGRKGGLFPPNFAPRIPRPAKNARSRSRHLFQSQHNNKDRRGDLDRLLRHYYPIHVYEMEYYDARCRNAQSPGGGGLL